MKTKPVNTIQSLLEYGAKTFDEADLFFGHGTDNAWDEAVYLLTYALGLPQDVDDSVLTEELTENQQASVLALFQQRVDQRIPAPYLVREAWFAGLPFYVNESVMIPRSPIAEFLMQGTSPWLEPDKVNHVLDLCTGSGCMAILSALIFEQALVDAVDLSAEALIVAKKNVKRHGVEGRVQLIESDLFQKVPKRQYDLIVSNPPYVGLQEYKDLPQEYNHEPQMAFTADEDGLEIVKRLLQKAAEYLTERGILVVEVGNSAELLTEIYPNLPFLWLEFEHGGHGVFLLRCEDLKRIS